MNWSDFVLDARITRVDGSTAFIVEPINESPASVREMGRLIAENREQHAALWQRLARIEVAGASFRRMFTIFSREAIERMSDEQLAEQFKCKQGVLDQMTAVYWSNLCATPSAARVMADWPDDPVRSKAVRELRAMIRIGNDLVSEGEVL